MNACSCLTFVREQHYILSHIYFLWPQQWPLLILLPARFCVCHAQNASTELALPCFVILACWPRGMCGGKDWASEKPVLCGADVRVCDNRRRKSVPELYWLCWWIQCAYTVWDLHSSAVFSFSCLLESSSRLQSGSIPLLFQSTGH